MSLQNWTRHSLKQDAVRVAQTVFHNVLGQIFKKLTAAYLCLHLCSHSQLSGCQRRQVTRHTSAVICICNLFWKCKLHLQKEVPFVFSCQTIAVWLPRVMSDENLTPAQRVDISLTTTHGCKIFFQGITSNLGREPALYHLSIVPFQTEYAPKQDKHQLSSVLTRGSC